MSWCEANGVDFVFGLAKNQRLQRRITEFFTKLGIPFRCFHDKDLAPEGESVAESEKNLQTLVSLAKKYQKDTGAKLLWGTANLFSHKRYMNGAATSPDFHVVCHAGAQVKAALDATFELGGENYVFWGGREHGLLDCYSPDESEHYELLERVFNEQFTIGSDSDSVSGEGDITSRPAAEIPDESVPSPYDPECSYRKKAGKQVKGYSMNVTETIEEDQLEPAEQGEKRIRKRNNVEASIYHLSHRLKQAKTVYRGLIRNKIWAWGRALWVNMRRIQRYQEDAAPPAISSVVLVKPSLNRQGLFSFNIR